MVRGESRRGKLISRSQVRILTGSQLYFKSLILKDLFKDEAFLLSKSRSNLIYHLETARFNGWPGVTSPHIYHLSRARIRAIFCLMCALERYIYLAKPISTGYYGKTRIHNLGTRILNYYSTAQYEL